MPKAEEPDDYDVFLQTFNPDTMASLVHAGLEQYSNDVLSRERLLEAAHYLGAPLMRHPYAPGPKALSADELALAGADFFAKRQEERWDEFKERVCASGVAAEKLGQYQSAFVEDWVDGNRRRHRSERMQAIVASLMGHDAFFHSPKNVHVINWPDTDVAPLFDPAEMRHVLEANSTMLDLYATAYLKVVDAFSESINDLYVRRGVNLKVLPGTEMRELNYLSSYSFGLSAAEQFAQTFATDGPGTACIFSSPLPAVQKRAVAFAPFIAGMTLDQLELVVAPPIRRYVLRHDERLHGSNVQIREFCYG